MKARFLAVGAVVVTLAGCGGSSGITLQQFTAAFARNGLPFWCVLPSGETHRPPGCRFIGVAPGGAQTATHIIGSAFAAHRVRSTGFPKGIFGAVDVFDGSAAARQAAANWRKGPHKGLTIIVVKNVF